MLVFKQMFTFFEVCCSIKWCPKERSAKSNRKYPKVYVFNYKLGCFCYECYCTQTQAPPHLKLKTRLRLIYVCPIEIGLDQAPFVVFVYFFPHLNMWKTCWLWVPTTLKTQQKVWFSHIWPWIILSESCFYCKNIKFDKETVSLLFFALCQNQEWGP